MRKLEGKTAIVTGAGQRVGRGIALAFAKEGAKVVIAEINPETAMAVQKEITHLGEKAMAVVCDVSNEEQVKRMVAEAVSKFGPVDILVNNAQKILPPCPLEEENDSRWDANFNTGPRAALYCMKAVFPYMKNRGGKIINFGSETEVDGNKQMACYAGAKAAMRGLSRVAAREWARYRINVNVIWPYAPGPKTREWESTYGDEMARTRMNRMWPLEDITKCGEDPESTVGRAAVFLASEDAAIITGHTLMVNGGLWCG